MVRMFPSTSFYFAILSSWKNNNNLFIYFTATRRLKFTIFLSWLPGDADNRYVAQLALLWA